MKKLVVAIATAGIVFTGTATINVSAEEYEVQERDTLWGIAQEHQTSVQHLININNLESITIKPGQKIHTGEEKPVVETYTVNKGDTLTGISNTFNVTVDEIKDWNDLSSTLIIVGQELKIPTDSKTNVKESDTSKEKNTSAPAQASSSEQQGETISVTATAYTAECEGCSGITSTGIDLNADRNKKVIAVDPSVIPLGSKVHVEGYGNAIAGDIGGAIKGNKIDVHVPTKSDAYNWGVKTVDVTILD
ncbi:MAG TPA: LysM peptidoglycan-binding domain-containing protein [Candidatus Pseudogracilibacillus intestinigallinarum]|uniref:LysM peptidoglycan-binding domain-containing protein n=1 Tax=Candidatus Pseudogracilibacillus intestinigallinarum TaxID=2838742 RepID=A0A9D1PM62_9BACI|nr:LysM peptidoglycan-binding domain-containing protein [Candidatus Pseudogracilibacillus intestinigallinarum]